MIVYRNRKSGKVVERDGPQTVLDRSSAWERVETGGQPVPQVESRSDLSKLKRGELNALAAELGIEDADKLPNAGAVVAAIEAKQAESVDDE